MTLTEFLEARLAEDEAVAREIAVTSLVAFPAGVVKPYAGRALREVEAKRAIVAEHTNPHGYGYCPVCFDGDMPKPPACPTLRALATVYSDHSDFREEWRP